MVHTCERASTDEPLISGTETDEIESGYPYPAKERRWLQKYSTSWGFEFVLPWAVVVALLFCLVFQYHVLKPISSPVKPELYSVFPHNWTFGNKLTDYRGPVQDKVRYTVKQFQLGFNGDFSEYQGMPSPEIEDKWSQLYESIDQYVLNIKDNTLF